MPIQIPGNPYDVKVQPVADSKSMGLVDAPKTKFGMSQAIVGLVNRGNNAMNKWQAEVDQTRAKEAINEAERIRDERANTPDKGWRFQLGKDAVTRDSGMSLSEEVDKGWQEDVKQIRAGLNHRQAAYFDKYVETATEKQRQQVNLHMIKQQAEYEKAVDQLALGHAARLTQSTDPRERDAGFIMIRSYGKQYEAKYGLPFDSVGALSPLHATAAGNLIDAGDLRGADEYVKANRAEMSPDDVKKVDKVLGIAREDAAIEGASRKILGKAGSWQEAIGMLGQIKDPKQRAKVRGVVRQEFALREEEKRLQDKELFRTATEAAVKGETIPPSMKAELINADPLKYEQLMRLADRKSKSEPVKFDNVDRLGELISLAENDPEKFRDTNIQLEFGNDLTAGTINTYLRKQAAVPSEQEKAFLRDVAERGRAEKLSKENLYELKLAAQQLYDSVKAQSDKGVISPEQLDRMKDGLFKSNSGWRGLGIGTTKFYKSVNANKGKGDILAGFDADYDDEELVAYAQSIGVPGIKLTPERRAFLRRRMTGGAYSPELWDKGAKVAARMKHDFGQQGAPTNSEIAQIIDAHVLSDAYPSYWK